MGLLAQGLDEGLLKKLNVVSVDEYQVIEAKLSDVLNLVLERSSVMKILELNERIAGEQLLSARGSRPSSLINSLGVIRSSAPFQSSFSSGSSQTNTDYLNFSASDVTSLSSSWTKQIDLGISYGIAYAKKTTKSSLASILKEGESLTEWTSKDPLYSDNLTVSLSIPLFQDWGEVNRSGEFRSENFLYQTKIQSKKSKLLLLSQMAMIYWDLVGVEKTIETLKAGVQLAERFFEDNKTRLRLGVLDQVEVKQSEAQVALIRQSLLREEVLKKQIEDQLKAALDLNDIPYGYKLVEEFKIREINDGFDGLLEKAYKADPDLELLLVGMKNNQLDKKVALNRLDTDLDLSLQYQFNGYGLNSSEPTSMLSDTKLQTYQMGLTWTVPLFDVASKSKSLQVEYDRARIDLQISNQKKQIKLELQSVLRNLKLAEKGIKLARISVSLEEDLLEKETEKFKLGNSTSFRVAQVQQDLSQAQKSEILSRIQYEKIFLSFLVLTDQIYSYYQLKSF